MAIFDRSPVKCYARHVWPVSLSFQSSDVIWGDTLPHCTQPSVAQLRGPPRIEFCPELDTPPEPYHCAGLRQARCIECVHGPPCAPEPPCRRVIHSRPGVMFSVPGREGAVIGASTGCVRPRMHWSVPECQWPTAEGVHARGPKPMPSRTSLPAAEPHCVCLK